MHNYAFKRCCLRSPTATGAMRRASTSQASQALLSAHCSKYRNTLREGETAMHLCMYVCMYLCIYVPVYLSTEPSFEHKAGLQISPWLLISIISCLQPVSVTRPKERKLYSPNRGWERVGKSETLNFSRLTLTIARPRALKVPKDLHSLLGFGIIGAYG